MGDRPRLLVVYDTGSEGPARLGEAARDNDCELLFVVADTDHAREMVPALAVFGSVVDIEDFDALRKLDPTGIVTFSEFQIGATADLAERLGLPYHARADVPAITRKDMQRKRFQQAGVDAVRAVTITSADQLTEALAYVGLPAIIKPVIGASSRNTVAVHTEDDCRAKICEFLRGESALLLEELLVGRPTERPWGDYIAVDCVATGDHVAPVFVTSKFALAPPFRERGGYGGRSVVADHEVKEVAELACQAVHALGIRTGIADVEIKLTPAGPQVIEVNGRLGGWVDDLAVRSNTSNPVDIAIRSALGRPVPSLDLGSDGPIAYHYLVVPPLGASRVRAIRGISGLRAVPSVQWVSVLTDVGSSVDWRIGARSNAAAVLGAVDTHEQLADVVDRIERVDWIEYD